ncbi:MAG TPA: hypothetical protein VLA80_14300, partial [Actinomycetota bacterium]|nr:hypothetical protein [Actinomycetota bacterium]
LTHPTPHTLFAFTGFLAGGIAVVLRPRCHGPFRYLWTLLGTVALGATVLALDAFRTWAPMGELGEGGLERWIVYPIVLWLVAFGSYLMATPPTSAGFGLEPVSTVCKSRGPRVTGTFGPAAARTGSLRSA